MARYHDVKETKAGSGTPERDNLVDGVRRLAYASLGLFAVMSDEVGSFYEKCVTRGEQKAKEARTSTRARHASRRTGRRSAGARQPIAAVIDRSGLATKSEMDALIARVDALARQIDILAEQRRSR